MKVDVRDNDRGYLDRLETLLRLREPAHIDVGILEAAGAEPHGTGASVLDVGLYNEFGTDTIPERSFIRAWYDEAEGDLQHALTALMERVGSGKLTRAQALELLGQRMVGQVQSRMSEGLPPPNAPSTVRQKGSSTPLIDTGVLRSSISYRVEVG